MPQHVLGDPMRLRQVLTNYLTNALKFTTTGSILLNVQRSVGHRLRFEVIDTGAGMDGAALRDAVPAVQPGRQLDHAQGRRHRPGPVDLQRARAG